MFVYAYKLRYIHMRLQVADQEKHTYGRKICENFDFPAQLMYEKFKQSYIPNK